MIWESLVFGLLARPWARRVASYAFVGLAVTLFILNLRQAGERAGRAAERLEQLERTNAIQRQMLEAASQRPRSRDERLRGVAGRAMVTALC